MSDTPRTDAACGVPGQDWEKVAVQLCNVAIKLETELAAAHAEIVELKAWKESALLVESRWDVQKVGKLLGLTLGQDIRPNIQPRVEAMQAEIARLREALEQERVQHAGCLTAAEGHTSDPAIQGQYGWSLAYQKTLELRIAYDGLREERERLDWLDHHCAFVADSEYSIGPYRIGELRKMADDGIQIDAARQKERAP
jgi:hypothetical protein